jgi:hypothetical protein
MRRSKRGTSVGTILLLIVIAAAYYFLRGGTAPSPTGTTVPSAPTAQVAAPAGVTAAAPGAHEWGHQTKTSGCQVNGPFPDTACTPGDVFPNVTKADICKSGYAGSVRNVTDSTKNKVYASYGIASHSPGEYEVDHLVSLELGGSNDISNLFPEAASPKPGFHEKDKVENYLHDQVCSGAIPLADAQVQIATDWLSVYKSLPSK